MPLIEPPKPQKETARLKPCNVCQGPIISNEFDGMVHCLQTYPDKLDPSLMDTRQLKNLIEAPETLMCLMSLFEPEDNPEPLPRTYYVMVETGPITDRAKTFFLMCRKCYESHCESIKGMINGQ